MLELEEHRAAVHGPEIREVLAMGFALRRLVSREPGAKKAEALVVSKTFAFSSSQNQNGKRQRKREAQTG